MIKIEFHKIDKYKNKSAKPKIIIPKKNVKFAVNRNKIKRQIRAILALNNIYEGCIIYRDENTSPNFAELNTTIKNIFNSFKK